MSEAPERIWLDVDEFEAYPWKADLAEYIEKCDGVVYIRAPQWISVEERLPIMGMECLVVRFGEVESDVWYRGNDLYADPEIGWRWIGMTPEESAEVTHWMPLPEPPDEQTT